MLRKSEYRDMEKYRETREKQKKRYYAKMSVAEKLVEIIKDERRERGKSYRAIAEEIGVHRNTLTNVKRKHGWCMLYVANQILDGLGYELVIQKKAGGNGA